ncbi:MAG: type II secretion system minor pseudopilin GspI [Gammaproteobacteria bacterium]|nr:type II secretion system minor pseudopilin GspI [Gammaproteobacteria bacterium]
MNRRSNGFTLLEILVALVVLAVALTAVIRTVSADATNLGYMRDKTLAQWVAINHITELHINKEWPSVGTKSGSEFMANRDWYWKTRVSTTADEDVRRIDVSVSDKEDDENPLTTVTAFIGNSS